jgi:hypothetical protein
MRGQSSVLALMDGRERLIDMGVLLDLLGLDNHPLPV